MNLKISWIEAGALVISTGTTTAQTAKKASSRRTGCSHRTPLCAKLIINLWKTIIAFYSPFHQIFGYAYLATEEVA
jgi:hypothetical protein